jgi:hypothetical protein
VSGTGVRPVSAATVCDATAAVTSCRNPNKPDSRARDLRVARDRSDGRGGRRDRIREADRHAGDEERQRMPDAREREPAIVTVPAKR